MLKMKIALLAACGMLALAPLSLATACSSSSGSNTMQAKPADGFMKSTDGTWAGMMDGKKYWYKLDKNAKLWWSMDGKKWAAVPNNMWSDKDGKWLKIGEKKLWWSADMGKTWVEVPEWKWEGPDGEWYKFDKDWSLWVNKK